MHSVCALDDLRYLDVDRENVPDEELHDEILVLCVVLLDLVHLDSAGVLSAIATAALSVYTFLDAFVILLVLTLLEVAESLDVLARGVLDRSKQVVFAVEGFLDLAVDLGLGLHQLLQVVFHAYLYYIMILLMLLIYI